MTLFDTLSIFPIFMTQSMYKKLKKMVFVSKELQKRIKKSIGYLDKVPLSFNFMRKRKKIGQKHRIKKGQ